MTLVVRDSASATAQACRPDLWKKPLATAAVICSHVVMYLIAAKSMNLHARSACGSVLAGGNNNRANNNANRWRALA
ncbi:MAG: hypothetical protein ABI389_09715 [Rhodanobacter sp.]